MNKDQKSNILKFLDENIRYDGRQKDQYREISIERGVSANADGSAIVKIGDTEVIVGVKMEIGTPFPDTPDAGVLMVNVELSPIASKEFETGPPGFNAIELARVTDRGVRESRAMDVSKLCIESGSKVWIAGVDIVVLNDAGNLFDACSLAAITAIKDTKMPALVDGKIDYHAEPSGELPLMQEPIGVTVYKIGNHLLIDPTHREIEVSDARLTVATIGDGTLCAMQKGGEGILTKDQVLEMVELAAEKTKELRELL